MKKTVIILSALAFIAGGCGQATKQQENAGTVVENNGDSIDHGHTEKLDDVTDNIKLVQEDLNIILYSDEKGETQHYEDGKELTKYLKVELIDKKLYESKKADAINFFKADTEISKHNGVIELPCTQGKVTFTDNSTGAENEREFTYLGQIEALNKYLIAVQYYEDGCYKFIDKENGDEIRFIDFPNISPDKKHIMAIHTDQYEGGSSVELWSIDGQKIKRIIHVWYKNWKLNIDDSGNPQLFFSSDGYLYATVKHEKAFWTSDGAFNPNVQYIRIKILN